MIPPYQKYRVVPGLPLEGVPELLNRIQDAVARSLGPLVIASGEPAAVTPASVDVTLAAVGSAPNADGASIAAQVLTLQPADGSHPGLVSTSAQTLGAGIKTFSDEVVISGSSTANAMQVPDSKAIAFNGATSTAFIRWNGGSGYMDYQGGTHVFDGSVQNAAGSGADGFKASQNLSRWHIGVGTTDYFKSDGTVISSPGPISSGTASPGSIPSGTGITLGYAGDLRRGFLKFTADYTAWSVAGLSKDIAIGALPARCRVVSVIADTTAAYVLGAGTISLVVGKSAGGNEYLLSHDVKTAPVVKGLLDADMGASLTRAAAIQGGDLTSAMWSAGVTFNARLTSSVGNLSTMSAGSTSFYVTVECL